MLNLLIYSLCCDRHICPQLPAADQFLYTLYSMLRGRGWFGTGCMKNPFNRGKNRNNY